MRSALLTFFVAVTSICFSQTTNDDWIYVTTSSDSTNTFYIRKTYGNKKENIIKIWIKTKMQKINLEGKTYNDIVSKDLYVIDCDNQRTKLISELIYDSKGDLIDSTDKSEILVHWKNVAPETIAETIVNKVCSLFN